MSAQRSIDLGAATAPPARADGKTAEGGGPGGKSQLRLRVAVGIAAVATGVFGWYALHANEETTDNAQVTTDVVAVPARVGGVVAEIAFQDNEPVKAGDVLARLDPAVQRAKLAQAEAELEAAKAAAKAAEADAVIADASARGQRELAAASLEGSQAALATAAGEVAQAAALAKSASAALRVAKAELDRSDQLFKGQTETQQRYDAAQGTFEAAQANLAAAKARRSTMASSRVAARSRVVEARARLAQAATVEEQIARAQAQKELAATRVQAAQAARDLAALDLSYTTISAPRSGVASNRTANVGQMIAAGQPVVNVVSNDDLWVIANFKETQVGRMHPGQSATISVDAYGGMTLEGEVVSLSGGTGATFSLLPPENATGNFSKIVQRIPVRIRLKDAPPDKPLRAGMSVVATINVRR